MRFSQSTNDSSGLSFTNLLRQGFNVRKIRRYSTLITMGPVSPQGLYQPIYRFVKTAKGLLRQADSETAHPEFIGVGGISGYQE